MQGHSNDRLGKQEMTDGDLVRLVREGSVSACETLVRRYAVQLLAICRSRVRSHHSAEDLAQESLLKALKSLHTLTDTNNFGPWVRSIAINLCRDSQRSARHEREWRSLDSQNGSVTDDAAGLPEETLERSEEQESLWAEIDALPADSREVLLLRYFDARGYDEMASLLEVSRATVNARLAKARSMLARVMSKREEQSHELR
jgi:RNA polymerase sigma factor (sigma-70 family)